MRGRTLAVLGLIALSGSWSRPGAGHGARPEGPELPREPSRELARPERPLAGRPAAPRPRAEAPLHARARDRDLDRALGDLDRLGALEDGRPPGDARDRPRPPRGGAQELRGGRPRALHRRAARRRARAREDAAGAVRLRLLRRGQGLVHAVLQGPGAEARSGRLLHGPQRRSPRRRRRGVPRLRQAAARLRDHDRRQQRGRLDQLQAPPGERRSPCSRLRGAAALAASLVRSPSTRRTWRLSRRRSRSRSSTTGSPSSSASVRRPRSSPSSPTWTSAPTGGAGDHRPRPHVRAHGLQGHDRIGTTDYAAEKLALAKVEAAYAAYDGERRKRVGRDDKKLAELEKAWKDADRGGRRLRRARTSSARSSTARAAWA